MPQWRPSPRAPSCAARLGHFPYAVAAAAVAAAAAAVVDIVADAASEAFALFDAAANAVLMLKVRAATSAVRVSAFAAAVLVACAAAGVLVPPFDRAACVVATNVVDTTVFVAVRVPVRVSVLGGAASDAATSVADIAVFVVPLVPSVAVAAGIRAEAAFGTASACTGRRTGTGRETVEASAGLRYRTRCRRRSSRTTRPACSPSPC